MRIEEFIIVDEKCKEILGNNKLRKRGEPTFLRDFELITMLIVGEYLGCGSDKKIQMTQKLIA